MDKPRYDIIDEPSGIYTVEVHAPGKPVHLVDGFESRKEAEAWVKAQTRPLADMEGGAT